MKDFVNFQEKNFTWQVFSEKCVKKIEEKYLRICNDSMLKV